MAERTEDQGSRHDVHNHLAVVLGFAQLCLDADAAGRRPERAHLEGIARAATAASDALRRDAGASG